MVNRVGLNSKPQKIIVEREKIGTQVDFKTIFSMAGEKLKEADWWQGHASSMNGLNHKAMIAVSSDLDEQGREKVFKDAAAAGLRVIGLTCDNLATAISANFH